MINSENIKLVEDVFDFSICQSYLAYVRGDSLFNRSLYFNDELIQYSNASTFFFHSGYLIFSTWEPDTYLLDVKDAILKLKLCGYSCSTEVTGDFVFISKKNEEGYNTFMINVKTHEMMNVGNNFSGKIIADRKIINNMNSIDVFSIPNEFLWKYTIPENQYDWYNLGSVYISERSVPIKAEIKRILGVYNEVVWIALNSGRLLGLDIYTGNLQHDLAVPTNFFAYFSEEFNQFDSAADSLLDEKRGVIFGLGLTYYWEVNLVNPESEYILHDISEQRNKKLIGGGGIAQELVWKDEEIFFYEWSFAQDPSYVGIFNRNTRVITWTSRELGDEGIFKGVKKVDYCDNRLYVLDGAKTLHIFER